MSLDLDARQRAMLEEFGIKLFWPQPAGFAEPAPAAALVAREARVAAPAPAAPVAAPAAAPVVRPVAAPVSRSAAAPATVAAPGIELMEWDALAQTVTACRNCSLCDGRREPLLGAGDLQADWLFVGEPPTEDEDRSGEPFVGDGGKLLDNMLRALGLTRREKVYLANVIKCRPSPDRLPGPDEVAQCEPFLRRQVELLRPRVIVAMGRIAVQTLLASSEPLGRLRGRPHDYQGVPVVVTYHPAYLLRNPADKARAWADLVLAQGLARG